MLVKQGRYDYVYAFRPESGGPPDPAPIEGNAFQTRNRYSVIVHYRDYNGDYDRVVGYGTVEGPE